MKNKEKKWGIGWLGSEKTENKFEFGRKRRKKKWRYVKKKIKKGNNVVIKRD